MGNSLSNEANKYINDMKKYHNYHSMIFMNVREEYFPKIIEEIKNNREIKSLLINFSDKDGYFNFDFINYLHDLRELTIEKNNNENNINVDFSQVNENRNVSKLEVYGKFEKLNKFIKFPNLTHLSLKYCQLNNEDFYFIENFNYLRELNLEGNSITSLSSFFEKLKKLEILNVSDNSIGKINFSSNKITCLYLDHNPLVNLNFLKNFPNLNKLSIKYCNLKNLKNISLGNNLAILDAGYNHFDNESNCLEEISSLKKLLELNLDDCFIHEINFILPGSIKILDILSNFLNNYSFLSELYELEELNISYNDLSKLDFSYFKNLKKLYYINAKQSSKRKEEELIKKIKNIFCEGEIGASIEFNHKKIEV
jgi:Leucine-rich repeat (LRR) protein